MATYYRNPALLIKLGERVRQLREKKGLTLHKLADLCGWDYSQIVRIEKGSINTSISHVFKIAEVLGVKPTELIDLETK